MVAVDLPGFGLVFRASPTSPFSYACSSLFELVPNGDPPALAVRRDGSLLVGSADGLRSISARGCPITTDANALSRAPLVRLALQSSSAASMESQVGYAVVSGLQPGLWRTEDGGRSWISRAVFEGGSRTTALVMRDEHPEQLYMSVNEATGSTLYVSRDGGASLQAYTQASALTLLHAEGSAPGRLWAIARDAESTGNRGFAILRADDPEGPWRAVLRVNYFGGFVVDPRGVIWVGDEIGGIYRSEDGGESFTNLASEADVACLAYGGSALWACNPLTPSEPVLQVLADGQAALQGVVALADVDRMVECPEVDVARVCGGAWVEWQRDVLMRPVEDAAGPPDAGTPSASAARASAGCAVQREEERALHGVSAFGLTTLVLVWRHGRRKARRQRRSV